MPLVDRSLVIRSDFDAAHWHAVAKSELPDPPGATNGSSRRFHVSPRLAQLLTAAGPAPLAASIYITLAFFAVLYLVLRPGYWINDDLKMIWNLVGYPGSFRSIPFLVHSNVLLGLALEPLYGLQTTTNWAMILFAAINVCSVCALVYVFLVGQLSASYKLLGVVVVLVGLAAPTLNLTFTFSAALASLSGICLLLAGAIRNTSHWRWKVGGGIFLIVMGALTRIEMLGLVLAFVVPGAAFILSRVDRWKLLVALASATLLVGASYALDKLYVRSFADWHTFYAYDQVREELHDAHRLSNLHNQIRRVGWSPNDQEMFARWFFPDGSIYSFEHVKFLVQNTPGTSQDPTGTLIGYLGTLRAPQIAPYLIFMLAIWLWEQADRGASARLATLTFPWLAAIGANLVLAWAYKDPAYVLVSTLAGSVVCSLVLLELRTGARPGDAKPEIRAAPQALLRRGIFICLFVFAAGVLIAQVLETSRMNVAKQTSYEGILDDLSMLQATGRIGADALIVSPAHGLPYDWSYPFRLTLPPIAYFDTGWSTFSPTYDRVLQQFGIASLPEALLHDDRLYLMTESSFTPYLAKYYQEHEKTAVRVETLYAMPNRPGLAGYDRIYLYRLVGSP